jgi:hypothetical protein
VKFCVSRCISAYKPPIYSPDGPKMSIFQSLPIPVFIFAMVSVDHGKKRTGAVLFKTARMGLLKELSKSEIF